MADDSRYGTFRDTRPFCFCDEPAAEGVEIDQVAALSGPLVIHAKLLPMAGETLAEDVTCVPVISQFVKEPILRVFALSGLPLTLRT